MSPEQQAKRVEAVMRALSPRYEADGVEAWARHRAIGILAAADEAVPVLAMPVPITDETVEQALLAFWDGPMPHYRRRDFRKMRAALDAALNPGNPR